MTQKMTKDDHKSGQNPCLFWTSLCKWERGGGRGGGRGGEGKREYGMQMHVERDMFVFLSKRPCPSVAPYVGPSARTRCRLGPLSLTSRTSTAMYRNPEILVCLVFIFSRVLRDSMTRYVGRMVGWWVGPSVRPH